jgi:glycosyltransferase involved in cell wall biosynthesis
MIKQDIKKSPIRVLHIINAIHFGGAEQVVLTITKSFDYRYIKPIVICFAKGLLIEKLSNEGIPHYLIPMKSKIDILVPLIKTINLIKKKNIDIIHTHTVRSNLIGRFAAFFTRRKCITHLHSPISRDFGDLRRGRLNEAIDRISRPIANRYIAVSYSLRKEMLQMGMPPHKIVTIHNALDLASFNSPVYTNNVKRSIREEYNIPNNSILLVLVALLRPRKGVEVIIKAMKLILKRLPMVYLFIVGNDDLSEKPDYGNRLQRLTYQLGIKSNIIFTGFRDDVPNILRQCNLMVLPSLFGEGLPMVILEAMYLGVPVVASKVEGIPEVIEDEVNGFLVEPGAPEQLAKKIIKAIKSPDLLRQIKKEARRKIIDEMDGHAQSKKIEKVYREIIIC